MKLLNMVQQQKKINEAKAEKEKEQYFCDVYSTIKLMKEETAEFLKKIIDKKVFNKKSIGKQINKANETKEESEDEWEEVNGVEVIKQKPAPQTPDDIINDLKGVIFVIDQMSPDQKEHLEVKIKNMLGNGKKITAHTSIITLKCICDLI